MNFVTQTRLILNVFIVLCMLVIPNDVLSESTGVIFDRLEATVEVNEQTNVTVSYRC